MIVIISVTYYFTKEVRTELIIVISNNSIDNFFYIGNSLRQMGQVLCCCVRQRGRKKGNVIDK